MAEAPTAIRRFGARARGFVQRHWQGFLLLRDRIRLSEEAFHLLLAGGVGIVCGLANLAYLGANELFKSLVFGQTGDVVEIARLLGPLHRMVVPALGGLAAGLVLLWGLRWLGTPGLTNLLEVVVAGDGRLPMRNSVVSAVSSLLSFSTGASIGREGAIVQLCATVASKFGQLRRWPPYRLRLLVACGAASGIAAAYNAPIGGAVFAAQIVLGNFSMNLFAPVVFASVISSVVTRTFFGITPWYMVPTFDFTRLGQLPWFLLLGAVSGLLGGFFLKSLRVGEKWINRLPVSLYGRLALAGLIVGAISVAYPEVWGNGYLATNDILKETKPQILFVLGLLLAKFLATMVTVGAGTVGGVFTPTLFLGAALGSLFGGLVHQYGWGEPLPTGAFALVGMASLLAATTHSPLLAMIMIFELSLNYSLMPPLMLACVISTLVARWLHHDSIYSEPLRRKGLELDRESAKPGAAMDKTVGELMREPIPPLRDNTPFREIADRFLSTAYNHLPVVDAQRRLLGMVALHDLKGWLNAGQELNSVIAADVMRPPPPCLTPDQRLTDVLPVLLQCDLRNVPVVNNPAQFRLVGAVARAEAMGLLSEAISARSEPHLE